MPIDINQLVAEVEDGLSSQATGRMEQAREQIEHYNLCLAGTSGEIRRDSLRPYA
jgi:hypothetical protein